MTMGGSENVESTALCNKKKSSQNVLIYLHVSKIRLTFWCQNYFFKF